MSMVNSSALSKIGSQKRKRRAQNIKLVHSMFTRSKSQICQTDPVQPESVAVPSTAEDPEPTFCLSCTDSSYMGSSIKDIRMRRIFTPVVNSFHVMEDEEGMEEGKRKFNVPDGGSDSRRVIDSHEGEAKADNIEKSEIMISRVEGARCDAKNGLSLKDHTISQNGSNFRSEMCSRKKVFKCSSSFSYERLLPYLMDIQNDDCGNLKFEIVDSAGQPTNQNGSFTKDDHVVLQFNDVKVNDDDFRIQIKKDHLDSNSDENELDPNEKAVRHLHVGQDHHKENANKVHDSTEEECGRMTPPDADILSRARFGCTGELMADMPTEMSNIKSSYAVSRRRNHDLRQGLTAKCGSSSINRSVLAPCSRLRLFKNPKSLSYRRLLPFLMDMSKNNSGFTSVPQDVISNGDSKAAAHSISVPVEPQAEEQTQKTLTSVGSLPPSDDYVPSPHAGPTFDPSDVQQIIVRSETHHDPSKQSDLHERALPGPRSAIGHLEIGSNSKDDSAALLQMSTVNNEIEVEQFPFEKPVEVAKRNVLLDENNGESMGRLNLDRSSFHCEASDSLVSPVNGPGPSKGILKRNRHGCRGLCTCLNCASFRLHADKAFEFSRNQLHDAEELATDLMKELANLRLLLEKSISDVKNSESIPFNQVVEQACNQALETENQAKVLLSHLNDDLNVHCRIPALLPPKVTFANYIRERIIPTNISTKRIVSKEKRSCLPEL